MNRIFESILKNERWIFLGASLLVGSFFFWSRYFVTGDGPAHIYNGSLIFDLAAGGTGSVPQYFEFNPVLVPNWTGHLLLGFFNLFLPVAMAEKVFLALYFFGFCYSFRYMVKGFNPNAGFLSILILPFAISQFIHAGFYNFSLAFVFLFAVIGFFARHSNSLNFKKRFLLSVLLLLIYFSHITVAIFAVMILFAGIGWNVLVRNEDALKLRVKTAVRKTLLMLVISAPASFLILVYMSSHTAGGDPVYLEKEQLTTMITDMAPLVGHGPAEHTYTHIYLVVLIVLCVTAVFLPLFRKQNKFSVKAADVFILTALALMIGYFILPDSDHNGGYISIRILYLFFVVVLARIVVVDFPAWLRISALLLVLVSLHLQLQIRHGGQRAMSKWAKMLMTSGEQIEPGAVVLPINCSSNWLATNMINYLGAEKPLVILSNYEAHHVYFPLRFKENLPIPSTRSIHPDAVCIDYLGKLGSFAILPDYLLYYGFFEIAMPVGCERTNPALLEKYECIQSDDFIELYRLKN